MGARDGPRASSTGPWRITAPCPSATTSTNRSSASSVGSRPGFWSRKWKSADPRCRVPRPTGAEIRRGSVRLRWRAATSAAAPSTSLRICLARRKNELPSCVRISAHVVRRMSLTPRARFNSDRRALSLPARVQPYPDGFETRMVNTNGTGLFVRVRWQRTGRCPATWLWRHRRHVGTVGRRSDEGSRRRRSGPAGYGLSAHLETGYTKKNQVRIARHRVDQYYVANEADLGGYCSSPCQPFPGRRPCFTSLRVLITTLVLWAVASPSPFVPCSSRSPQRKAPRRPSRGLVRLPTRRLADLRRHNSARIPRFGN
jgi:hypothetical protein